MMFTGIVEEIGTILQILRDHSEKGGFDLIIQANVVLDGVKLGDSIAVNGTCLTVTRFTSTEFQVGLAPETLRKTNLGVLKVNDKVNLERSLAANGRIGGHFVQGHVDGQGVIVNKREEKDAVWFTIQPEDSSLMKYIVNKGYIAVDGTSLTLCNVEDKTFEFMLVPFTQDHVIIPKKQVGDRVNLEVDIMGKYVEKFLIKN